MNVLQFTNQKYIEGFEGWYDWIGKRVCVSGNKPGILKYFGKTEFADGVWCGVELNEPVGKNDGSVKGVQYFTCKDNHGIFVSLNKVEKVHGGAAWDKNIDGQKKLKNQNRRYTLHSGAPQEKISSVLLDEETCFLEKDKRRKTTFFNFPNDNVSKTSFTSHSQKPQLNNSYVISMENKFTKDFDDDDILNKTVILTEENEVNCDDQQKMSIEKKSVLNSTFDVDQIQAPEFSNNNNNNNKEIVLDGTFVLDENVEGNQETIGSNISSTSNFKPLETDESLCILSVSQMKDFTICAEQFLNNSNAELQQLHLAVSCDNSNMQLRSESKPVSLISPSSEFFQTDLKVCQENVLVDSVFLHDETENGNNVHIRGSNRNSQKFLSCRSSGEAKDICFQPTHDQSSTPSDESKNKFGRKMSLIKSLQLEDSFKFDTKRHSSSTPNKPATPLELLVQPNELKAKEDLPVQFVDDYFENINLSLIDNEAMPNTILDSTQQKEQLKRKRSSGDHYISDSVLHSVKADFPCSISSENSNVRRLSGETTLNFDGPGVSEIICLSARTKPLSECYKQLENAILNVTQDLSSASTVNSGTIPESKTEKFDLDVPQKIIVHDMDVQEDSSIHKGNVLLSSKVHNIACELEDLEETLISAIQRGPNFDSSKICEAQSDIPSNFPKSIQKTNFEEASLYPQHDMSEMKEKPENDILHQTFNCNSSHTVPQNSSYTISVDSVNENEGNGTNDEMVAISKVPNESECSAVIGKLHNPPNECLSPAENASNEKKSECNLNVTQNLNATVCISSAVNSHNLTFDVSENSGIESVRTERLNLSTNLTRQSVGPASCTNNVYCRNVFKTASSKNAPVTNASKPCVPSIKEKTVPSKCADSVKQNTNMQSQKQLNRRYSAAPRITNSQENKTRTKTQVVSKINTNLKTSRPSLPRQSLGLPNNAKKQSDSDSSVFKVPETKSMKNVLNYQRIRQDARKENDLDGSQKYPLVKRKVGTPPSSENKSFILKDNTQAVNIPEENFEKGTKNGVPTPSLSRRSSTQSVSSQSSSKIALFNKNNTPANLETKDVNPKNGQKLDTSTRRQTMGIPPSNQKLSTPLRNQKLYDSVNSQRTASSNIKEKQNLTSRKPESPRVSGRLSESGPKRGSATKVSITPHKNIRPCQEVKKKWVSKAELVKEIQNLGASCESKTKEINFSKIQLRKATLGFEALAVLISYVNEEMDPFSQIPLFKEMANTEAALKVTGAQLKCYLTQLELINNSHKENVGTLADKLEVSHRKEMKKLKRKHSSTLEKTLAQYKEEITRSRKNFDKQALERKEHIELVLRELNQGLEKQRHEQTDKHAEEIREVDKRHEIVEDQLKSQVKSLHSHIELVERRTKQAEEKFFKDKSSKIRRALAKAADLQKETESLKAVLEMKNSQVKDIVDHNAQMKEQLQELSKCREEIFNLEKQTNDVQQILHQKTILQRELSMRTHDLQVSSEKEIKSVRRRNLENEELKWRLCESMTKRRASSYFFEPRIPTEGKRSLRSAYRSSSLSVLHSGCDENSYLMTSSMPAPTSEGQGKTKCNRMSVSLVSTLPSYEESTAPGFTPKRNRSLSVKPSPSKYFKSPTRRSSFKDYISNNPLRFIKNNLRESMFYVPSPDQDSPGFLRKKNSVSWTIDDMSDYYEDMDGSYLYISGGENNESESSSSTNGEPSEASVSYKENKLKCEDSDSFSIKVGSQGGDESKSGRKIVEQSSRVVPRSRSLIEKTIVDVYEGENRNESCSTDFTEGRSLEFFGAGEKAFPKEPKRPTGLPRSFSCAPSGSLNEKYSTLREKIDRFCHADLALNGSSTSSNSSNSMSPEPVISERKSLPTELKSAEAVATAGVVPLADESAIQDSDPLSNAVKRGKFRRDVVGHIQDDVKLPAGPGAMDTSFSSEDAKDKTGNSISFSIVSAESSSQCTTMTDSTNIDISWGDDEFPSDNAK